MGKNKYTYIIIVALLILAGYLYFSRTNNTKVIEQQRADISEFIDPKEILKYDPNAPKWMQNAESCTRVGGKIFCKLKGE